MQEESANASDNPLMYSRENVPIRTKAFVVGALLSKTNSFRVNFIFRRSCEKKDASIGARYNNRPTKSNKLASKATEYVEVLRVIRSIRYEI